MFQMWLNDKKESNPTSNNVKINQFHFFLTQIQSEELLPLTVKGVTFRKKLSFTLLLKQYYNELFKCCCYCSKIVISLRGNNLLRLKLYTYNFVQFFFWIISFNIFFMPCHVISCFFFLVIDVTTLRKYSEYLK